MPRSKKPKAVAKNNRKLGQYVTGRLQEMGLSVRAAARRVGISAAYLSDIATGKKIPEVGVCNAIADYFGDPKVMVLKVAGWLEDEAAPGDEHAALLEELKRLVERDPQFLELLDLYTKLKKPEEKEMLLRIIHAVLSA